MRMRCVPSVDGVSSVRCVPSVGGVSSVRCVPSVEEWNNVSGEVRRCVQ